MALRLRRSLLACALSLCAAAPAMAQTGSVQGRVTNADTGVPIVSVFVEVKTPEGRTLGSALTNPDGRYRIGSIPAGSYTMQFSATGFGNERREAVQVDAGAVANVDATMQAQAFELEPIAVSVGKTPEKAIEAPARVEVVTERDIDVRPAITPVDHLRSTPAVDVITSGLQSTNVVVRGFNNIFSGALHTLTDNRIAGIPSLRVNLMHFIPQTNDDFDRMEVVLGPGSALYGPNTANGVLHILTKSTLEEPQTTFSVAGGERSAISVNGRTSHRLGDNFGFKVSAQYFRGDEWEFLDPVEQAARAQFLNNRAIWILSQPPGLSQVELEARGQRLAARDFDISRWALDLRSDIRLSEAATLVLSGGLTNAAQGIELTGIGAGQVEDWKYGYYQARLNSGRLFAQAYLNTSNAGDTYLLRTGAPIVDESKVLVGQIQHGTQVGRFDFIYGGDWIRTTPETGGTINGSREDDDEYDQYGVYGQGRMALSPKFDLVLAAREDWHTELDDPVFSPRAALVFKPDEAQSLRFTYNRAFSTPTSLNLFLDIDGGPAGDTLGSLGFRVRALAPGKDGIRLTGAGGGPAGMRSPFATSATELLPISAGALYGLQVQGLARAAQLRGEPLSPQLIGLLQSLVNAPEFAQIQVAALNPVTRAVTSVEAANVQDIPGIEPSISQTFEIGYKGVLAERLLLAADAWRSRETNFTSPLVVRTPFLLVNPQQLVPFLVPRLTQAFVAQGAPQEVAAAQAAELANSLARIPGGVASSADMTGAADLLATYVNFGELDLWGLDLSATYLLSDQWSLSATASFVSDHNFCLDEDLEDDCPEEQLVALNAPKEKGTAALAYRGLDTGINGELRVRHTGEFPVNSADFVGLRCIGGGGEECVDSFTLVDLSLGYALPNMPGASVQLSVSNLFDTKYRSFVGVPEIGRLALLRVRYEF